MELFRKTRARLCVLFRKEQLDSEMADEMRSHIELQTQEHIEAGMSPEQARYAALKDFGHGESIQESCREQRGVPWLEMLARDLSFGLRILWKQALCETIRTTPGVRSVSLAQVWYARYLRYQSMLVDGRTPSKSAGIALSRVGPDYFTTLNIPILRGRTFTAEETKTEAPVLIVSESFAKQFWPGQDPLLHRLKISETNAEAEIIGVAKDGVREIRSQYELQPYEGDFYAPLSPDTTEKSEVWVRTGGNPYDIMPVLHREVPALDTEVRFGGRRLSDLAAIWVRPMLFLATAVGVLGTLALLLASIGVYGVVAYAAAQRTQEMGIRTALGAQPWRILRLMLWEGMRFVILGLIVGLVGSAGLSWLLRSYFYGLNPVDPVTFVGVSVALSAAALMACYLPARRATKVDPMVALRYE